MATTRAASARKRLLVLLSTLTLGAAVLSGCGSSEDSTGGQASTGDYDVEAADSELAPFVERPTDIGVDDPLDKPAPGGRTIAYMDCGVPQCAVTGGYLKEAAEALGWTMESINAGYTAETIKAAWAQVLADKPDGVVTGGTSRELIKNELAQAEAEGIPVVSFSVGDEAGDGISLVLQGDETNKRQGERIANYMLANSEGQNFDALAIYSSGFPDTVSPAETWKAKLEATCSGCGAEMLDVPISAIGSDLPSRVTGFLSSHPDVKWIYPNYADMVSGLPQALNAAGLGDVKILSTASNPQTLSYFQNGELEGFDVYPAVDIMWRAMDYFAREATGADTSVDEADLPAWFVDDPSALPSDWNERTAAVADTEDQYKALWGVN